jgi:hypothetical protein
MNQFWQLAACEMRLYLRSKSFWFIGTLAVAAIFTPNIHLLLIQLMATGVVTRDEKSGFSGILALLPHHSVKLFLARAVAVFCLLLGLWPMTILTVGFLPGLKPAEWLLNGQSVVFLTLKYITVCATALGFVFAAGVVTRYAWRLYLIIGACWAVGEFFYRDLPYLPSWCAFFLLGNGEMKPEAPSAILGYFPQHDLLLVGAAFQIALAILCILLVAVYGMVKRNEPAPRLKTLLLPVAAMALLVFFTGGIIWREINQRESGFRLGLREAERAEVVAAKAVAAPELKSYQLQAKLRTSAHYFEGKALISLKPVGTTEIVHFTLRNCFQVESVSEAVNGKKLKWGRNGSYLWVRVPQYRRDQTFMLEITYSGRVWEWFPRALARPNGPVNLVAPEFSILRSGYAWYPVPGIHSLYRREYYAKPGGGRPGTTLWAERVGHAAVPFQLTVDIDNHSTIVSNLERSGGEPLTGAYQQRYRFHSLLGRDVFLLAGPYRRQKKSFPGREGLIEVYCYRQHRAKVDRVLKSLAAPYLFYEDLFQPYATVDSGAGQSGKISAVVEMPRFLLSQSDNIAFPDTVLIREDYFKSSARRPTNTGNSIINFFHALFNLAGGVIRDSAIFQRWWQDDFIGSRFHGDNIANGLLVYLHALYAEQTEGREFYDALRNLFFPGKSSSDGLMKRGPVVREVFMTLEALRRAGIAEPAFKKLTRSLYQVYLQNKDIRPVDFAAAVETALASVEYSREKAEPIRRRLSTITRLIQDPGSRELEPGYTYNIDITLFKSDY